MTTKTNPYVIRQGDYLTMLAHERGFDAEGTWAHERNAEVRARWHRDVLPPGGVLHVLEPLRVGQPISSGAHNFYRARIPKVAVHLVLMSGTEPLADEPCSIEGVGLTSIATRTDQEGKLSFDVPLNVREVRLLLEGVGQVYSLLVGHMDPITEPFGVWARLDHMGYLSVDGFDEDGIDEARLADAIQRFQTDQQLEATGVMDDATRDTLRRQHGS